MKYSTKSVVFGRKPRQEGADFKTAFFKLYNTADPLGTDEFPTQELDFANVEKVVLEGEDVQYYLEGNDLVIQNISAISITQDGSVVTVQTEK